MIRIKDTLINGKDILYITKQGRFRIFVYLKNHEGDGLEFIYDNEEERDTAFENIDAYGRD